MNRQYGNESNTIIGTVTSDVITAGRGNDEVYATAGNDTYNLGKGSNTINYDLTKNINYGTDTINVSDVQNLTIKLTTDVSYDFYQDIDFDISSNRRDYIIRFKNNGVENSIVLKDYFVNNNANVTIKGNDTYTFNLNDIVNLRFLSSDFVKGAFTGTALNDSIDATLVKSNTRITDTQGNNTIYGSNYADTIVTGAGNDILYGSTGVDNITLGAGTNKIYFDGDEDVFTTQTINLTKGENLEIFVDNYDNAHFEFDEDNRGRIGRDYLLVLEKDGKEMVVRLKNLWAENVLGETGSVKLYVDQDHDNPANIERLLSADSTDSYYDKNCMNWERNYDRLTANWFNDEIDVSGAERNTYINAGDGENEITGSSNSDTVIAGKDDDIVYASSGDDVYTLGKGQNNIYYDFTRNDGYYGTDTINLTKDEQLTINITKASSIDYKISDNGKDAIIVLTKDGVAKESQIVIKDYAASDVIGPNGYVSVYTNNELFAGEIDLYELLSDKIKSEENSKVNRGVINGTRFDDNINAESQSGNLKIYAGEGDNKIKGSNQNDTITAGSGDDTIYATTGTDVYTLGKGENTVIFDFSGDKKYGTNTFNLTDGEKITFDLQGDNVFYTLRSKGNDLYFDCFKTDNMSDPEYQPSPDEIVGTVVLKNYFIKNVVGDGYVKIKSGEEHNPEDLYQADFTVKGGVYTFSRFNDDVDVKRAVEIEDFIKFNTKINAGEGKNTLYGSKYCENYTAGTGNDLVVASGGNDVYTLGIGENTIEYDFGEYILYNQVSEDYYQKKILYNPDLDDYKNKPIFKAIESSGVDTINLTKDENLKIILANYDTVDYGKSANLKDCIITLTKDSMTKTIIINNYYATDVIGTNGSLVIEDKKTNQTKELSAIYDAMSYDADDFTSKGAFTGSRFDDYVDATNVYMNTTINVGEGYNTVTGSYFNDVITGGNEGNFITEYSGVNRITTGKDGDRFVLSGTSNNTINAGNGKNDFTINGYSTNNITSGIDVDTFNIAGGYNTVNAGNGDNDICVTQGINTITTGTGDDDFIVGDVSTSVPMYVLNTKINTGAGFDDVEINNGINNVTLGYGRTDKTKTVMGEYDVHNKVTIHKNDSINTITGSAGNDLFDIQLGKNNINSGAGNDVFLINGGENIITSSAGNNQFEIMSDSLSNIKTNIVTGGGHDEFILNASSGGLIEADINSGAGDDTFTFVGGMNSEISVDGGKGNDIYYIKDTFDLYNNMLDITDKFGSNELIVSSDMFNDLKYLNSGDYTSSNYAMLFNVSFDKRGNAVADLSTVVITKDRVVSDGINSGLTINGSSRTTVGGFDIHVAGSDENLKFDANVINSITQNVASWLKTEGYASVAEAIADGNNDIFDAFLCMDYD